MNVIKNYNVTYNPERKVQCKNNILEKTVKKIEEKQNLKSIDNSQLEREMKKEKEDLLKRANQKANKIIQTAKDEAKEIEENAYAKGHDKGYMQGYEEGFEKGYSEKHEELEMQIKDLKQKQEKYNQLYSKYLLHAEQDILEIVMEITNKLTKDTFDKNPKLISELIIESIKSCSKKEKLIIRINPKHFEYINENKEQIIDSVNGLPNLKVVKDKNVSDNECYIETPYGNISSSLDSQLDNIYNNLENMVKRQNYNSSVDSYEK